MGTKNNYQKHYEEELKVGKSAESIFAYADNHANFSSHMNKFSWIMGGGRMNTTTDERKGQRVGSHIKMRGKVFGITIFLDEVVTRHEPPYFKEWQTVGDLSILVIGHHKLGFEIKPAGGLSKIRVYIDYNLPESVTSRILGYLFGELYAKWCVHQMISRVGKHFSAEMRNYE